MGQLQIELGRGESGDRGRVSKSNGHLGVMTLLACAPLSVWQVNYLNGEANSHAPIVSPVL